MYNVVYSLWARMKSAYFIRTNVLPVIDSVFVYILFIMLKSFILIALYTHPVVRILADQYCWPFILFPVQTACRS